MLRVGICDDEQVICSELEGELYQMAQENEFFLDVDVFSDGGQLINHIKTGVTYDLLFLDIEMEEVSGIDVGQWLRQKLDDHHTKVIYISWEQSYAMDLFQIRPLDFLIKPIDVMKVRSLISEVLRLTISENQWFYYSAKHVTNRVLTKDILYFESENRLIKLVTKEGSYTFYGKLSEVLNKVDGNRFWQVHKSYIINYDQVQLFEYDQVTMNGDKSIPISQSRRKDIRNKQLTLQSVGKRYV